MASPTYTVRALVLRKTKLGESDLICTLLADDGCEKRVIAKGARKPKSSFAARLELYSTLDVLCNKGRNLDIAKEVRIVSGRAGLRTSFEHAMAAAPMAELLGRVIQPSLQNERLFQASEVALDALESASPEMANTVCAAHLLKVLGFAGFKPSFNACAVCGDAIDIGAGSARSIVRFSEQEGGVVCSACQADCDAHSVSLSSVQLAHYLLHSPFSAIIGEDVPSRINDDVLTLIQGLVRAHVGSRLKALDCLLSSALSR